MSARLFSLPSLARPVQQLGVGGEHHGLLLHRVVRLNELNCIRSPANEGWQDIEFA
jgi:hypothetical protein